MSSDKKESSSIFGRIGQGISSASKAIVRTPAQDRLNQLRNRLVNSRQSMVINTEIAESLKANSVLRKSPRTSKTKKPGETLSSDKGSMLLECLKTANEASTTASKSLAKSKPRSSKKSKSSVQDRLKPGFKLATNLTTPKLYYRLIPASTLENSSNVDAVAKERPSTIVTNSTLQPMEVEDETPINRLAPVTPATTNVVSVGSRNQRKRKLSQNAMEVDEKFPKTATQEETQEKIVFRSPPNRRLVRLNRRLEQNQTSSADVSSAAKPKQLPAAKYPLELKKPPEPDESSESEKQPESASSWLLSSIRNFFSGSEIDIRSTYKKAIKDTKSDTTAISDHYRVYVVPDTNVLLNHLTLIKDLIELSNKNKHYIKIFMPYAVIEELDKLKQQREKSVSTTAMRAIKYLNEKLENHDKALSGQSAAESTSNIIPVKFSDDSILNCCLQLKEKGWRCVLVSNDINLRNKALVNDVKTYAGADVNVDDLKKFLSKLYKI